MRNITFYNSSGHKLAGVIHEAEGRTEGPTVIICHGFRGSKEGSGRAAVFSEEAVALGYRVLRFDFRGTGGSQGAFADITLSGYMDDISSAIGFLRQNYQGPIIGLGRSFGGTTLICKAAADDELEGVITWASPHDLHQLFIVPLEANFGSVESQEVYDIEVCGDRFKLKKEFFLDLLKFNVLEAVNKINSRPVLVIHGSEDETVPMEQGIKLFENASYPKELAIIAGADHRFERQFQYVCDITLKWLQKYFPA